MAEFRNRTFADKEAVDTDGNSFIDCRFDSAILRYAGGEHPTFTNCTFGETGWFFTGAALRTIQLLQQFGVTDQGRGFVNDLFRPGNYITE